MMKVYSDHGNIHTLKIAIAAELAGEKTSFVETKQDEKVVPYLSHSKLPVLELDDGQFLHSANAACRYVLAKCGVDVDSLMVDQWLEWEATELQPVLWPYLVTSIGQGKPDQKLAEAVRELLSEMNESLHHRDYLVRDQISAADIVMWSALFPALCDNAVLKGWSDQFQNISNWFNKLSQHPAFQTGFTQVTSGKGISAFKASLLAQPAPLPINLLARSLKQTVKVEQKTEEAGKEQKTDTAKGEECTESTEKVLTQGEIAAASDAWLHGKAKVATPRQRTVPVLPNEGERNILITSALPYVNNVPHLGNIIGCVLSADVYARFCRLRNYNILYICGTDEYGTATETKAVEEGLTPQQICDKYNALHTEVYDWFNIEFDYFGRTTTQQQTQIAQDIFWKLYNQGYVIKDIIEQLLCEKCDRFLADRFVEGTCPFCAYEDARGDQCDKCGKLINATELKSPKCKLCKNSPVVKQSEHLFLDLPQLEPQLSAYLDTVFAEGLWTSNAKLITKSWIRDGLKPRCITRDLKWGTPVPLEGYTDKVFYVWFDAPIGYISITANYTTEWEKWWKNPKQVDMYNFMAKDNVPFHSVIFPCSLLGANDNYTIVRHLSATEYLNYEDGKFSKSRGVGVFGNNAKDTGIPADIWRFYLLFVRPESQDSSFSWDDFLLKNNSELLNNLGNFVNRALMFVSNFFGATIQKIELNDEDKELLAYITRELQGYVENLEKIRLREGIRNILSISRLGNQYMQSNKPWVLVKGTPEEKLRAGSVVSLGANVAVLLSVMLQPYMPETSKTIQEQLQAPAECNVISEMFVCYLPEGHKISKPSPLFKKLEAAQIAELKAKFAGQAGTPSKTPSKTPDTKQQEPPAGGIITQVDPAEVERLTAEVTQQGNAVRELKSSKAAKADIDAAVTKLLDLKRSLAIAQGQDPNVSSGSGKKKGKKK